MRWPLQRSTTQHHAGIALEILEPWKTARMSGHAPHGVRARIVHLANHPATFALFRRSAPLLQRLARQEPRLHHAQRLEDVLACELVERLARDAFDELAQNLIADVRIDKLCAGLVLGTQRE